MKPRLAARAILSILVCIVLLIGVAAAHPGRTDSSGGHHVGGTSEYHYHHGYSAHQHPNGVCPYDFDDKTGSNSGSSSGGDSGSSTTAEKIPTATVTKEEETKTSIWTYISTGVLVLFFGFPVLCWLAELVASAVDCIKARKQKLLKQEEDARRFNEERNYYIGLYTGKTIEELCDMPPDAEIGEDGLPKMKEYSDWGPRYTFYVSRNGQAFHSKSTCTAFSNIKIHAWNTHKYTPCKRCKPLCPDLRWFKTYKQIKSICELYQIDLSVAEVESGQYWAILPTRERVYADDPNTLREKINKLTADENAENGNA